MPLPQVVVDVPDVSLETLVETRAYVDTDKGLDIAGQSRNDNFSHNMSPVDGRAEPERGHPTEEA